MTPLVGRFTIAFLAGLAVVALGILTSPTDEMKAGPGCLLVFLGGVIMAAAVAWAYLAVAIGAQY